MPAISSPLAQTFTVEADAESEITGRFLSSVDVYFSAKDDTLPVTLEIRTVKHGYPSNKVLPFSQVVKNTGDVNVSATGATATTFTFPSLVFVEIETEYALVLKCATPDYITWITRIGDTDIGGTRTISKQPHVGVLFKSHASTTLFPSLAETIAAAMQKNYNLLKSIGIEGRKNVLKKFDVDKMCQTTFTEYNKLIE